MEGVGECKDDRPGLARALTALQMLRVPIFSDWPDHLALPNSFSQLTALTWFATEGIRGTIDIPAEPATWDPRFRRMEGEAAVRAGIHVLVLTLNQCSEASLSNHRYRLVR